MFQGAIRTVRTPRSFAVWAAVVLASTPGIVPVPAATLHLEKPTPEAPPRLTVQAGSNEVVTLQSSARLEDWSDVLVGHGHLRGIADLRDPAPSHFYRAQIRKRGATDDGKNVIRDLDDDFRSPAGDDWRRQSRWIKFALLLDAPHRVWFQDSDKYPFHYEFGVARLPGFAGLTRAQFDDQTLRIQGQRAVLGAVLFPPATTIREIGIQFVGLDAYPKESVAAWFSTVQAMIQRDAGYDVLYLPTFEQSAVARANADWFADRGIPVGDAGRWVVGDECYAPGWSLGRLVSVPTADIGSAYREGRLLPTDILLAAQVPAEVPPLAGIVSLTPATPNSHVAILSQSFGIPFVYVADEATRERVLSWVMRDVMIRAVPQFGGCELTLEAVDGPIAPEIRTEILAHKIPPRLVLPGMVMTGGLGLPVDTLRPSDIAKVGGKAANFGGLARAIPQNAPRPAIALTFDLWEGFLDHVMPGGGRSLRVAIEDRLSGFVWPPDMRAVQSALAEIREWITDEADFTASRKTEVLRLLQEARFDPDAPIRFRSSTNVEDGERFSGAGLYDSYSGCLADELDGDTQGPSRCDAEEAKERGVFRALRKVYASFYNDNAFLERLRHRVDEADVGMAVLVHPSSPDRFESANGVATFTVSKDGGRYLNGNLVTQAGAVSVANPDSTAIPELVSAFFFGATPTLTFERASSLVPLGGKVMTWEADYRKLAGLLDAAAASYEAEFPSRKRFVFDFEYKKLAPDGRLSVKQIREVPELPDQTYLPWLVATTNRYAVFQGEHGDLLAHHRLKSEWAFRLRTTRLGETNLASSLFTHLSGAWLDGTRRVEFGGPPDQLASYSYRLGPDFTRDGWVQGTGDGRRDLELRTHRVGRTSSREGPLVVLGDHTLQLQVKYAVPQPTLGYDPETGGYGPTTTALESVYLAPVTPVTTESLRQERDFAVAGIRIRTSFWWPAPPKGIAAGYTAPLQAWIETRITGLVPGEIVLRDPWAQTYHPGHHNFFEEFLFEPRLDPSVDDAILRALEARNVKALMVGFPNGGGGQGFGFLWGLDETLRKP